MGSGQRAGGGSGINCSTHHIERFHDYSLTLRLQQHGPPELQAWGTPRPTVALISVAAQVVSVPLLPSLSIHQSPARLCVSFLTTCTEHPLCSRTEVLLPEPPGTLWSTELICRVIPVTMARALPAGSPSFLSGRSPPGPGEENYSPAFEDFPIQPSPWL